MNKTLIKLFNSSSSASRKTYISSWVWTIFTGSIVLLVGSTFLTTWTSTGSTSFFGFDLLPEKIKTQKQ